MKQVLVLAAAVICARGEVATVAGLSKPVEILRDRWGVPHIYAENSSDLFFAQGWITAKDRLFQIDLLHSVIIPFLGTNYKRWESACPYSAPKNTNSLRLNST